jgi:hypothetical protein
MAWATTTNMISAAISSNPTRNGGSTVLYGNASNGTNVTNTPGLSYQIHSKFGGGIVTRPLTGAQMAGGTVGHTFKALNSGNFAVTLAEKFVIMTKCTELAGVSNSTLNSGAGRMLYRVSIAQQKTSRHTDLITWSTTRGAGTKTATTTSYTYSNGLITWAEDSEAIVGWGTAGEFSYMIGTRTAKLADYATH